MMHVRTLALVTFVCWALISCQKEVDDTNFTPTPNPVIGDSNYLDKIYLVYDIGTGVDTQDVVTFTYDSQKRISKWREVTYRTNIPYIEFNYFYDGNDTIPNKTIEYDYDTGTIPDTSITFYTFDASQRSLRDSSVISQQNGTYQYYYITDYSYEAGKKYGFSRSIEIMPGSGIQYRKDTATVDASGNILSNKSYRDNGSGFVLFSSSAYTYDDHINPFAHQNIYKVHQFFPSGETLFWEYMPGYNITSQVEYITSSGPNPWLDWSTTYTYNQTGLPAMGILDDGAGLETFIYTYKSL